MASLSLGRAAFAATRRVPTGAVCRREVSSLVSALEEFPDLPSVSPSAAKAGTANITTLENGLIIATEDGSSTSTVSLTFPNGGSSGEHPSEKGAALANRCLAFKAASGMSSLSILRALENEGASPFTSANRYSATVGYTVAPESAADLVGAVVSATTQEFEKWDVKDAIALAKVEADAANSSAEIVLTESLYSAAYGSATALGRPFFFGSTSKSALESFRARTYTVDGAVLSATGIENHDEFVSEVTDVIAEMGSTSTSETAEPSAHEYLGGETMVPAALGSVSVALSFGGPSDSLALMAVLKHCLSLSGASSFAVPGLVGVYGSAPAAEGAAIVDSLCSVFTSPISSDTIARAKALAKAEAAFALDNGSKSLADSMALNVLHTGSFSSQSVVDACDAVTEKDVTEAFASMLKSNPSLAAVGGIDFVPPHATVASRFS
mmetsp:Transcript_48888/g.72635  ORF Transcript_48888/g.72635 Transcript_48888/m.72635 type:complete len:439 (+) Transcript_48888:53-1369(+)|eukprot:CAMPEP_0195518370 /NCGR_PEP_ID=MMETSP0794_2-20130614/12738_1 /TAXON_ID=515487 /ORGANISM="Stephanopyxis turris, Strain CCMP 815" /LENGTH=438 /DNA_ID=CAMNT_0040647319 /DNA_START=45 /DNA_END=1361 /DNA_ORIENTATION=-